MIVGGLGLTYALGACCSPHLQTADGPKCENMIHPRRRTICVDSYNKLHVISDHWRSDDEALVVSPSSLPPEHEKLGDWTRYTEFYESCVESFGELLEDYLR